MEIDIYELFKVELRVRILYGGKLVANLVDLALPLRPQSIMRLMSRGFNQEYSAENVLCIVTSRGFHLTCLLRENRLIREHAIKTHTHTSHQLIGPSITRESLLFRVNVR